MRPVTIKDETLSEIKKIYEDVTGQRKRFNPEDFLEPIFDSMTIIEFLDFIIEIEFRFNTIIVDFRLRDKSKVVNDLVFMAMTK